MIPVQWSGVLVVVVGCLGLAAVGFNAPEAASTGEELYRASCAACHGNDGRGEDPGIVGFDTPLPDFTDCNFATREPDADWLAVTHQGGPVRGFAKEMPAFGEHLSSEELLSILGYIRTMCVDDSWPRGELNFPRPLVTTKAYPEDEAVLESAFETLPETYSSAFTTVYEKRIGARGHVELSVPVIFVDGKVPAMLGNIALGGKRVVYQNLQQAAILTVGGEVGLPTGTSQMSLEPFVTYGKGLPADGFLQLLVGAETGSAEESGALLVRGVLGKTLITGKWGRAWSPMVEVLSEKRDGQVAVDIVPQVQVTLNKRQHVVMNIGLRVPTHNTMERTPVPMMHLLWEWFDGGFIEGW